MTLVYGYCDTATGCRRVWGLLRPKVADQHTGHQGGACFRPPRLGSRLFTNSVVRSFGGSFVWAPSLLTHQFQAKPCRCSRRVVSIIERINLDCVRNTIFFPLV
ncbi:MAG: hypothetical protein HOD13_08330 [Rhodospirillaceae bacterium]|nr:hypothetical protein [Rhodospirillaceae bacterium]